MPQLRSALTNRIVVEQAKGFLREQLDVSVDEAFSLLRRYARANGDHLTDVARQVDDGSGIPVRRCWRRWPNSAVTGVTGSATPCVGAPHGLVDQSLRDHVQLDVLGLAHLDEPVEGHLGAATRPAADDADRLIDHRSAVQRPLQLFVRSRAPASSCAL